MYLLPVLTLLKTRSGGVADLQEGGIVPFVEMHKCVSICHLLELQNVKIWCDKDLNRSGAKKRKRSRTSTTSSDRDSDGDSDEVQNSRTAKIPRVCSFRCYSVKIISNTS
jgi:hypothetical protein